MEIFFCDLGYPLNFFVVKRKFVDGIISFRALKIYYLTLPWIRDTDAVFAN